MDQIPLNKIKTPIKIQITKILTSNINKKSHKQVDVRLFKKIQKKSKSNFNKKSYLKSSHKSL